MKNLTNMLKQAQQMQSKMQEMQAKLEAVSYTHLTLPTIYSV